MTQYWPSGAIFTIGHSTLAIADFIAVLQTYEIRCLADVRTVPRSRYNPQFNADALGESLSAHVISYASLKALGGLRRPRADSPNGGWREEGFRGYADYMQTGDFERGLAVLLTLGQDRRTAIMCAEAAPQDCHRSLIADALAVRGIPVIEILSATAWREHKLTSFAEVTGMQITYPPKQRNLF